MFLYKTLSMMNKLKIILQYVIPQHLLSRFIGKLAKGQGGMLTQWCIQYFIQYYQVNMQEAKEPNPKHYRTFNEFFTRQLKANLRPIALGVQEIASPADGVISQLGLIKAGRLLQAKGFDYSLQTLLGGDHQIAQTFLEGSFMTTYLSPKDYHRIHMPVDGQLKQMVYIPGRLFSVNQVTTKHVPELFTQNERLVCLFDTAQGPMSMVLVGATIVAGISVTWAGDITPRSPKQIQTWHYNKKEGPTLGKGEEVGHFMLGSTVICIYPKGTIEFLANLKAGSPIQMGEVIAHYCTQ